jgi:hypothetical protein
MLGDMGVAVIVNGEIIAWFKHFDDAAHEWCTENYFGKWLTWPSEIPVLYKLTKEEEERAEVKAQEWFEFFNGVEK